MKALSLLPALAPFALALIVPSTAHAIPYEPDYLEAVSVASRFVETGTETACINCNDLDPTNDLTLTLEGFSVGGNGGSGGGSGFLTMTGFLQSIRDADLTMEYDVRVVTYYGLGSLPEELAAYPLPSIVYGTISGFIQGLEAPSDFDFIENCCNGIVGSANIQGAHPTTPWKLPENASNYGLQLNSEVHWGEMPYTPDVTAVPEPTTLLLFGGGLIGAGWKRRRQMLKHSQGVALPQFNQKERAS